MGSLIEINDTLRLSTNQGFPSQLDLDEHQKHPITAVQFHQELFSFSKDDVRIYHLDPVRVYLVQNIDGKWLFWGHVLIQSQHTEKKLQADGTWDGKSWITSGTYKISKIYSPEYQRIITLNESPIGQSYFSEV